MLYYSTHAIKNKTKKNKHSLGYRFYEDNAYHNGHNF